MNTRTQPGPASSRFVAPSVREALRLVREKLGPDAIVLSNRVTPQGVEIVASTADAKAATPRQWGARRQSTPSVLTTGATTDDADGDSDADAMRSKVDSMRSLINDQLADLAWNAALKRDPLRGHLLRMLLGAGFSVRLAKDLLAKLPERQSLSSGIDYVKSMLAHQLPMLESEDTLMQDGGVYALMGPTGVGKTTTTAKLAARCVMRFGSAKLALVTTDSYRIGAYEQLRIYGQILGVSVHAVKDAADLELVLANLRDKHMVLIDTVGMSQRDRAVSDQVAMLCGASRPVKRLLLLNASSHGDTLNEVVHAYRHGEKGGAGGELAGCIFTKVDEATHPGVMLDMAIRHQLPVHYVSNGQKVPENLMLGDRSVLIDSVFQAKNRRPLFVATDTDPDERLVALSNEADVAAAHAVSQRLRSQCQQLIEVLAHNVEEVTSTTDALAAGQVGFNETRALWPRLFDDQMGPEAIVQTLLSQAGANSRISCRDHVLAIARELSPPLHAGTNCDVSVGTLLLSDRTGLPFAAPNPLLASPAQPVMRQLGGVQLPRFTKPVVHLLAAVPPSGLIQEWQSSGVEWIASGSASLRVVEAGGDMTQTLAKLAAGLSFSAPVPLLYWKKPAWSAVAQALVSLCPDARDGLGGAAAASLTLRCVVRRIIDANSGKPLAHSYTLASTGIQATAQQIAQWPAWRAAAEPYFKLLNQGIGQFAEEMTQGDAAMLKRLLITGQAASTVFRLQRTQDAWAKTAQKVLAQLAGRVVRSDRPVPGPVLLEGLGKLFLLLDALKIDDSKELRQPAIGLAQA